MTGRAFAISASLLALAPCAGFAQTPLGATELTRARSLLEISRAELTAEQFSLLSSRLAQTEQAYIELTTVTEATGEAAAVAGEGGAATAEVATTGGRALLSGVAELLPLLILVWPSTAHAPGMKEERPQVRAARAKLEERVKALAQAARQVEAERQMASRTPRPRLERKRPKEKPAEDRDGCDCICGPPQGPPSERERIGRYVEWRCRSICVEDYGFKYNEYVCR